MKKETAPAGRTRNTGLTAVLQRSPVFVLPEAEGEAPVELSGRLARPATKGRLILLMPSRSPWGELAVELKIEDVMESSLLFEDSAGRKTYRLRVAAGCTMTAVFRASDFAARVLVESAVPAEPPATWRTDLARPYPQDPYSGCGCEQRAADAPWPATQVPYGGAPAAQYRETAFGPPE